MHDVHATYNKHMYRAQHKLNTLPWLAICPWHSCDLHEGEVVLQGPIRCKNENGRTFSWMTGKWQVSDCFIQHELTVGPKVMRLTIGLWPLAVLPRIRSKWEDRAYYYAYYRGNDIVPALAATSPYLEHVRCCVHNTLLTLRWWISLSTHT